MDEFHLSRVVALVAFTFMQAYSYQFVLTNPVDSE